MSLFIDCSKFTAIQVGFFGHIMANSTITNRFRQTIVNNRHINFFNKFFTVGTCVTLCAIDSAQIHKNFCLFKNCSIISSAPILVKNIFEISLLCINLMVIVAPVLSNAINDPDLNPSPILKLF